MDYPTVIFGKHLAFMTALQKVHGKVPDAVYYELEGQFKDMCQIADKLSGGTAFTGERVLVGYIAHKTKR